MARIYLLPAALAPFLAALPFAFDGIYIGATWTRAMRNLMLVASAVYGLALVAAHAAGLGNGGLWLSFLILLAVLLILPLGLLWSLGERSRGATSVLIIALLTVAFLVLRLVQIHAAA